MPGTSLILDLDQRSVDRLRAQGAVYLLPDHDPLAATLLRRTLKALRLPEGLIITPHGALNVLRSLAGKRGAVVPVVVLWDRLPRRGRWVGETSRPQAEPWTLTKAMLSALGPVPALVAAPIALPERPGQAQGVLTAAMDGAARTRRAAVGPTIMGQDLALREVLADGRLQGEMAVLSRATGEDHGSLEQRARRIVEEMAADYRRHHLSRLYRVFGPLWRTIFGEFQVDWQGLDALREAMERGLTVLVPTHRSHMDYLIISHLLLSNDLFPPHIAAGDNLTFWPMGYWFRRCAAFFIRRTIRDDRLYTMVLSAYMRALVRRGCLLEVFLEGQRSRSGRVLEPKLGLLSMVLDGLAPQGEVTFIPTSLHYERSLEVDSYVRILQGGCKGEESLKAALAACGALRGKYGPAYIEFARPLGRGHEGVKGLGRRLIDEALWATKVTPTAVLAASLLAMRPDDSTRARAFEGARALCGLLARKGARLTEGLRSDPLRALEEAWAAMEAAGEVLDGGEVPSEARPRLAYYRNTIVDLILPEALVALVLALRGHPGGDLSQAELVLLGRLAAMTALRASPLWAEALGNLAPSLIPLLAAQVAPSLLVARVGLEALDGLQRGPVGAGRLEAKMLARLSGPLAEGRSKALVADALAWLVSERIIERRGEELALCQAYEAPEARGRAIREIVCLEEAAWAHHPRLRAALELSRPPLSSAGRHHPGDGRPGVPGP